MIQDCEHKAGPHTHNLSLCDPFLHQFKVCFFVMYWWWYAEYMYNNDYLQQEWLLSTGSYVASAKKKRMNGCVYQDYLDLFENDLV